MNTSPEKFLRKNFALAGFLLAASLARLNAATFFGPTPYLSSADIPAGLYVSGAPTFLENFEDGNLNPNIIASAGEVVPPNFLGVIDSVDADDGVIDGSGLNGHSWFAVDGALGVKFTFPHSTIAAGLVWTDGSDAITFSAFGPGDVPLGVIGPFSGLADGGYAGGTAEDRFFGVRDAGGVESIFITSGVGGIELDHVQYELASAQDFVIDAFTIAGGSGTGSGGAYSISGTAGLPGVGQISGDGFTMAGGFWRILEPWTPPVEIGSTTIFDNTSGSANGYESATTNNWLAERFCVGTQPYSLDSLSLLLVSGDNNGEPRLRMVRLRIYLNDPVAGKPALDTGVIMNLTEATNPITLPIGYTEAPIQWRPATRFILAPNQCYWAVLSTDIGIVGEPASATMPTGDAASFGRAASPDAGVTWNTPDNLTSRKMLILGTPLLTPKEFIITGVSLSGNELRFSFPANSGRSYVVERRNNVALDRWETFPGSTISSAGGTVQITLPIPLDRSQQFYRMQMLP